MTVAMKHPFLDPFASCQLLQPLPCRPPSLAQRLGCNAELIVDEFGEKLMEELDYVQEARNIEVSFLILGFPLNARMSY